MDEKLKKIIGKYRGGVLLTAVTAYDFPSAKILDEADIDIILVGDSVGTNVLGYASEREVSMDDMVHHTKAVCRAVKNAFVIADLPYKCADTATDALTNASALYSAGADCVKIEGWEEKADIVKTLTGAGINVCAHIGYNPQLHDKPRVFGKAGDEAQGVLNAAKVLTEAGASLVVLEMVPHVLGGEITQAITAPTIGIGSGNLCSGQVMVLHDLLGLSPKIYKHARAFANLKGEMFAAFKDYADAVKTREFPAPENFF